MYSIENFRAFNVRCFSDPRTFFNSELLSIYGMILSDTCTRVYRMRLGMFDPANDSSYHTLSPTDVNTADSQVFFNVQMHACKCMHHWSSYSGICTFSYRS